MRNQKNELVRKPRKLLSKEKSGGLISFQNLHRNHSRELLQLNTDRNAKKPENNLTNLTSELADIKDDFAKLINSNRYIKKSIDSKSQRDSKNSKDKAKKINSYHFEYANSKITIQHNQNLNQPNRCQNCDLLKERLQNTAQELQKLQTFVLKQNTSKQANEAQENMIKLNKTVEKLEATNIAMISQLNTSKNKISKLILLQEETIRRNKKQVHHFEEIIHEKQHIIDQYIEIQDKWKAQLAVNTSSFQHEIQTKHKQIKILEIKIQEIKKKERELEATIRNLENQKINNLDNQKKENIKNQKIENIKNDERSLNKKVEEQKLMKNKSKKQLGLKYNQEQNFHELKIKQLEGISQMQQQSIQNQLSDIHFLEGEIKKLSIYKQVSRQQAKTIEELNEIMVKDGLKKVNQKYPHA